ncbi:hypothetical protein Acor_39470 [Acrocarpospora corrugata]|uniref:Aminoglycoside phosphotransferase domain-containing protein n=1 Tax=Acrocarpospora corrugata TaxID=35763 RepID=A0A5M3W1I8_9ACTN|nr:phosphotransferase [Acrocarpospora corrugata]GES01882.1 hypothetical protein Acor_39470 [Acrocarpospora corrugata]
MRDRPADLTEPELIVALTEGWGIEAHSVEYLPVGAGSYHWSVIDQHGTAWFVKIDDLGVEAARRDDAFNGLARSCATALALRPEAGLDFVLAPTPTTTDALVRQVALRYALSVFPMVAGAAGQFGTHPPEDRAEVVDLLAELHRATPIVANIASRADLVLPGRDRLEEALQDLGQEWTGGPYAEPARTLLSVHTGQIQRLLADFDRRADQVRNTTAVWVVTHGEPHPGNIMRTPAGLRLIDWGTVQIAPPERDLWMLTPALSRMLGEDPDDHGDDPLARYTQITGRTVTSSGLALYALWWRLADIAIFADDLRRPHDTGEDIAASLTYLTGYLESSRD